MFLVFWKDFFRW